MDDSCSCYSGQNLNSGQTANEFSHAKSYDRHVFACLNHSVVTSANEVFTFGPVCLYVFSIKYKKQIK